MKKKMTMLLTVVMALSLVGCGSGTSLNEKVEDGCYVKRVHYTDDNVSDIPQDAINQVMFAYSETVDVIFETKLTLNDTNNTYTLEKLIDPAEMQDDNGESVKYFMGEWEFTGSYKKVSDEEVILATPDNGKCNIHYATALNYSSLEPQTQDWVSSDENPEILLRFNNWYPVVNNDTTEQKVIISSDGSLEFE